MNRISKILLCALISPMLLETAAAQTDICIGKSEVVHSGILDEDRTFWVYLPETYADSINRRYPVIWLLDGELFFHELVAIQRFFSKGRQPLMSECIIVGILNTDRTRDLTPVKSAYRRDGTRADGNMEVGGGADRFTRFLCDELRPTVNAAYRCNGKNVIVGHSFGGLFVLNALLFHRNQFDVYVALDPSFWWDKGFIYAATERICATERFDAYSLYVGVSSDRSQEVNNLHWTVARRFQTHALPKATERGLRAVWKNFPDETHGTIPFAGMLDVVKSEIINKLADNGFY